MNNTIKPTTPTTTWCHRKTIQAQRQEVEELKNKLEFNEICLRAALADLKRMDEKLLDAQDEFFNLGDACMNLAPDPDQPFKKPLEVTK